MRIFFLILCSERMHVLLFREKKLQQEFGRIAAGKIGRVFLHKTLPPPTNPLSAMSISCFAFTCGHDSHDADGHAQPHRLELRILQSSTRPSRHAPIRLGVIHPRHVVEVALSMTSRRKSCFNTIDRAPLLTTIFEASQT